MISIRTKPDPQSRLPNRKGNRFLDLLPSQLFSLAIKSPWGFRRINQTLIDPHVDLQQKVDPETSFRFSMHLVAATNPPSESVAPISSSLNAI